MLYSSAWIHLSADRARIERAADRRRATSASRSSTSTATCSRPSKARSSASAATRSTLMGPPARLGAAGYSAPMPRHAAHGAEDPRARPLGLGAGAHPPRARRRPGRRARAAGRLRVHAKPKSGAAGAARRARRGLERLLLRAAAADRREPAAARRRRTSSAASRRCRSAWPAASSAPGSPTRTWPALASGRRRGARGRRPEAAEPTRSTAGSSRRPTSATTARTSSIAPRPC